jgi:hypothetical protein
MIIRDISELEFLMTEEQKKKAKADYDTYFGKPYEGRDPIMCTSPGGDEFLKYVDVDNWD